MRRHISRRQLLASGILGGICSVAGCGTILYPERRGQRTGTLDTGVVVLDGLGLLLFFVPGVIAFAVDFSTGAIYLPEGEGTKLSAKPKSHRFQTISVEPTRLSHPEIAQAVSQRSGQTIRLEEGEYHTAKLPDLDHFWPALENLLAVHRSQPTPTVMRAQSP